MYVMCIYIYIYTHVRLLCMYSIPEGPGVPCFEPEPNLYRTLQKSEDVAVDTAVFVDITVITQRVQVCQLGVLGPSHVT